MDSNIPVYIIVIEKQIEQDIQEENDDVDSVISVITFLPPSYAEDLWDAESRWVESSYSPHTVSNSSHGEEQKHLSGSLNDSPKHPERSLSFTSYHLLKSSTHGSSQYSDHNQSPRRKKSPSCTPKEIRKSIPSRTTRLTRMADRAKAVATRRARTPPRRRNSLQRHSMPPNMPIRRRSTNGSSLSSRSSLSPAIVARTVRRSSLNLSLTTAAVATHPRSLQRESLQCQLLHHHHHQRQQQQQQQQQQHLVPKDGDANHSIGRQESTGGFRLSTLSRTTPPRLPQRYPSERNIISIEQY